ncbi:hypothetical protein Dimus_035948, partial [Dionaea muscipula]
ESRVIDHLHRNRCLLVRPSFGGKVFEGAVCGRIVFFWVFWFPFLSMAAHWLRDCLRVVVWFQSLSAFLRYTICIGVLVFFSFLVRHTRGEDLCAYRLSLDGGRISTAVDCQGLWILDVGAYVCVQPSTQFCLGD